MGEILSVQKKEEIETEETKQKPASYVLAFLLFGLILYALSCGFMLEVFGVALLLSFLTLSSNDKIRTHIKESPVLIYYSIFLSVTIFFSLECHKKNKFLMILFLSNILVCLCLFLTYDIKIIYLFVFINYYVILRIFFAIINDETL